MTARNVLDNIRTREVPFTTPWGGRSFSTSVHAAVIWSVNRDASHEDDLIKREDETARKNILHLFYGGYIPQLEEIIDLADRVQFGLSGESREQAKEIVKRVVKIRNEMKGG